MWWLVASGLSDVHCLFQWFVWSSVYSFVNVCACICTCQRPRDARAGDPGFGRHVPVPSGLQRAVVPGAAPPFGLRASVVSWHGRPACRRRFFRHRRLLSGPFRLLRSFRRHVRLRPRCFIAIIAQILLVVVEICPNLGSLGLSPRRGLRQLSADARRCLWSRTSSLGTW